MSWALYISEQSFDHPSSGGQDKGVQNWILHRPLNNNRTKRNQNCRGCLDETRIQKLHKFKLKNKEEELVKS